MIDRIIQFSASSKVLVFSLVAAGCLWGIWCIVHMPLDALPDLTEPQVIILSRWDRSPDIMEDQVTYPIISALNGAPRVKTVRGLSDFGFSYIYVIFEDGTDIYWARSRTIEYLSSVLSRLPEGVKTEIGPDATGLGWVFQYILQDSSHQHTVADLRSYQDWYLKNILKAVPGVAEVASIGGFTQQYQVNVDPNRLRSYGIPISRVADAVRESNQETGARLLEFAGAEYMIRGHGYVKSLQELENTVLTSVNGTPIFIKDVGRVVLGPDLRRGVVELDGRGEVVSGIVIMRDGYNALSVIGAVKERLKTIAPGMPKGVTVVPVYDRSTLITRAIDSAKSALLEVIIAVVIVILIFLSTLPSALIPVITMPVALLLAFIPLYYSGSTINIMSLSGMAIACGALVDAAIIVVEQAQKKLELRQHATQTFDGRQVVLQAIKEVGSPTFFALLVMAVAFLPVLVLEGQAGKLFRPLAYSKTFAVLAAAVLGITFDPALRLLLTRYRGLSAPTRDYITRVKTFLVGERIRPEEEHPLTGRLIRMYEPVVRWSLRWKTGVILGAVILVVVTVPLLWVIGSEFMPQVDEGSLLYMPSTMPGISIDQAFKLLQVTDSQLASFPEVDHVLGKAGRSDSATDSAPLSMFETLITLKPETEWRHKSVWYSSWAPRPLLPLLRRLTPDHISEQELISQMNQSLQVPGLVNSWTMPIRGRIEMLSTGIRTPLGLKIQGPDLNGIQDLGQKVEAILRKIPGTRNVFAERAAEGYFLDVTWNRQALARYGLSIEQAQNTLATAVGGENVGTAIQGRARYPMNVRYLRDYRSDLDTLSRVLVAVNGEQQVPLSELATLQTVTGPAMIRDEAGMLTAYLTVDVAGRATTDYVTDAKRELQKQLQWPNGYTLLWSGQYELMEHVRQRLMIILPLTIAIIILLLYANTQSVTKTLIIILAVPFSAVGALWTIYLLGYNMSTAVWVGIIALLGVDAETGVFMLLYLDLAYRKAKDQTAQLTRERLEEAIVEGSARRVRPKFMTFATMSVGLVPMLWATGAGSEIMKRIAAPMVGGIVTSFILELLVYPAVYALWRERTEKVREAVETQTGP